MKQIIYFIQNNETLTGSIVGAFLAAAFGMITQVIVNKRSDKNEGIKIVELVKNEMYLNFQLAKQMAITKETVYEFQTEYYDKFLEKIMLIKDSKPKNEILVIYTSLKLYNAGISSKYALIINNIRELNEDEKWGLQIESEEELTREISIYQSKKSSGELIELELVNYQGKDKRGYYGIMCSIDKLYEK
jgi:hypothetical protein